MKKEGSILIEVVAAIMILTLTTTFIVTASIQNFNILKKRVLQEDVEMAVCNLMKEFKYNMPQEELEIMLSDGEIGFRYDENFSKKLSELPVRELEQGTDVKINEISKDDIGLKLKIVANIKSDNSNILVEKEFTKSWWMDEV